MIGAPDPFAPIWLATAVGFVFTSGLAIALLRPAWVVRRPRWVLACFGVVSLAAVFSSLRFDPLDLRLTIDPSTESMLPRGDPDTAVYHAAIRDFGDDQVYVIALEAEDVFTTSHLAALERVGNRISRLPGVRRVQSLSRVTAFRYERGSDWIEVGPFVENVPTDPLALARLRQRALGDPIHRKTLVGIDGRSLALNATFRDMTDAEFIAADLDAEIRAILADEAGDGRRFHVSGRPHIKSVMYQSMTRDLAVLIPAAIAVVACVLAVFAGSIRGVALPLATELLAIVWTFGAIAWLEVPLTVLTVLLAPTLVAIGGVYGLHVVTRFEEVCSSEADAAIAAQRTLESMWSPVAISGVTTMVGFAALLTTDVPAVFEVGAFSALGVASVTLISLLGIPAALASMRVRTAPRWRQSEAVMAALDAVLARTARCVRARSGTIIVLFAGFTALALALIPRIVIDTDYLSYFDEDAEVRREFEEIDRLLAGAVPLFLVVDGGVPGALREPALLRALEALQRDIDTVPGVGRSLSFLEILRVLNRAVERDDPAAEVIPGTRPAIAELLFMIPKETLQRFATVDHASANLIIMTGAVGSAAMRSVVAEIDAAIEKAELPDGVTVRLTGNAILLNRAADGVARAQPRTVGLAAVTIFVLLSLTLRSPRLGIIAMIPNVVPIAIFYGFLGAGAASLSLPVSLIGSIALGIAVDATAHFLVRYRAERRSGASPEVAAQRCGERVGRPVAVGAAMLSIGFATICLSEFATLREFGMLTSFTLLVCCVTDLVLLPALLVRLRI